MRWTGGFFLALALIGCGEVRFTKEEAIQTPPRPVVPVRPTPPPPPAHEEFVHERPSGALVQLFVIYPTLRERDVWTASRRNLERFAQAAALELQGFSRVYLGLALDVSASPAAPVQWFELNVPTGRLNPIGGVAGADVGASLLAMQTQLATRTADRFSFFENLQAWTKLLLSAAPLTDPVWFHTVYLRDDALDLKHDVIHRISKGREDYLKSLAAFGDERAAFSLYSVLGEEGDLTSALSEAPIKLLTHQDLHKWETGDPISAKSMVRALRTFTSKVILTHSAKPGTLKISIEGGPPLDEIYYSVDGKKIELNPPTALVPGDRIEVEYEIP